MENSREVLLKVEHLCQYFKSGNADFKAVDDVSFDIYKGEVFGLVGESGCGKTTTGRAIIKAYNITSGNVFFKGVRISAGTRSYQDAIRGAREAYNQDSKSLSSADKEKRQHELSAFIAEQRALIKSARHDQNNCDRVYQEEQTAKVKAEYESLLKGEHKNEAADISKRYKAALRKAGKTRLITQIQMVFQDPIASLDPRMTVREIIAEGLKIQGEKDENVINEKVFSVLEMVGLVREHASRYPHEFSGGQRQRIGVARAIIMRPELIIADEPVSALDVSVQAQVINLLNDLRQSLGLTILFIAHDLSVVKYFSNRIGVMYYGKLVELASSDELFAYPLHPYTKSLLSAIPRPDPISERTRVRTIYRPLDAHDYSKQAPTMREIKPGHFVYCNDAEIEKYQEQLRGMPYEL